MNTSAHGIRLIEAREGIVLHGYKDSRGLLTIGCGHLVKQGEAYKLNGKITQEECDRLLSQDLKECENAVNALVKVPLADHQFDALVSWLFNCGSGALKKSTVLKKLNAGDYNGAANALMLYKKPPEIIGRRQSEKKQFVTPY